MRIQKSFSEALKHVRQTDVILVGGIRDLETISTALTTAETGHLVFATLHTQDAPQSINRVVDLLATPISSNESATSWPPRCRGLSPGGCFLVPTNGLVVACEILVATPAVRNLIREGKSSRIYSAMQAGAKHGIVTIDDLGQTGDKGPDPGRRLGSLRQPRRP